MAKNKETITDLQQEEEEQPNYSAAAGEQEQGENETPQEPQSVPLMVFHRRPKRGELTPTLAKTPTPRHGIHLGAQKRGLLKGQNPTQDQNNEEEEVVNVAETEENIAEEEEQVAISPSREPDYLEEQEFVSPIEQEIAQEEEDDMDMSPTREHENEEEQENEEVLEVEDETSEEEDEVLPLSLVASTSSHPPKPKKKPKKASHRGKHIPKDKDALLPKKSNGQPWGEAPDKGKVLFRYNTSWAARVCEMQDQSKAIKYLKHQRAETWRLGLESSEVQELVKRSPLWHGIENSQVLHDSVITAAFRERYFPETDTFHFAFGEMTITPDDVQSILGLNADGKAVFEGFDNNLEWNKLYDLVGDTLGWSADQARNEFEIASCQPAKGPFRPKVRKLMLKRLRESFQGTQNAKEKGEVIDPARAKHTATSFLLYSLGTIFFPDQTGNRVNVCYLQLLQTREEYAWGTATLAFLLDSLRKASRQGATNIAGNVGLLQAWVYDHFPTISRPPLSPEWEITLPAVDLRPTGQKFPFQRPQSRNKEQKIDLLRAQLDALAVEEVIFDPYLAIDKETDEDERVLSDVAYYNGPIFHPTGFVMTNPRRTFRQICCVQKIVTHQSFKLVEEGSHLSNSHIKLNYLPTVTLDAWINRKNADYQIHMEEMIVSLGTREVEPDYLAWFYQWGHPYVINHDPEALRWLSKEKSNDLRRNVGRGKKSTTDWKAIALLGQKRAKMMAESLCGATNTKDLMLKNRLQSLHDPHQDELFRDLERGSKRSRPSSSSARLPTNPSADEETEEEPTHIPRRRTKIQSSRRAGPRTRGGGGQQGGGCGKGRGQ